MKKIDNLNSSQLELLVALTEQGSFSEAAQELGLTQSAVSHGLARLETELGLILVERGRRGVTLTKAGKEILPYARDVVAHLNVIRQIANASDGMVRGKLRFGITYPLPVRFLMEGISTFRAACPEVELIFVDDTGLDSKNWVANGTVDVGIVLHPTSGIDSRLLLPDEMSVVIPADHPLAAQTVVPIEELFNQPLIFGRLGRERVTEVMHQQAGTTGRSQVRHMVSDTQMLLKMARSGIGIALLSRAVFDEAGTQGAELTALPLSPPLLLPLGLGVRSWEAAAPIARRFIETLTGTA